MAGFNPRPSLLTGESTDSGSVVSGIESFNPRPSLLTGESYDLLDTTIGRV